MHGATKRDVQVMRGVSAFALLLICVDTGAAQESVQTLPYDAWIRETRTRIQLEPDHRSPIIGLYSRGDVTRVVSCTPACNARRGYARVLPRGYVRLTDLGEGPRPAEEAEVEPDAPVRYGRTRFGGSVTLFAPDPESRPRERHRGNDLITLVGDARRDTPTYMRRAGGGHIATAVVRPVRPSTFAGEPEPTLPLAFVLADSVLTPASAEGQARTVRRYDRMRVTQVADDVVHVAGGTVPRERVRIARTTARPRRVPEGGKWVHVDVGEQVLVAYEGDTPVFATLIASGRYGHATRTGLFPVFQKTRVMTMSSAEIGERYDVQGVAHVLFFAGDLALHAAYWHDRFGSAISHGCVNLSPSDAARVYAWAPPEMPAGFRTVYPEPLGLPSLYVLVTR